MNRSQDFESLFKLIAFNDSLFLFFKTHFSGDSQDSCKGYTSISVREPLCHIQTHGGARAVPDQR